MEKTTERDNMVFCLGFLYFDTGRNFNWSPYTIPVCSLYAGTSARAVDGGIFGIWAVIGFKPAPIGFMYLVLLFFSRERLAILSFHCDTSGGMCTD